MAKVCTKILAVVWGVIFIACGSGTVTTNNPPSSPESKAEVAEQSPDSDVIDFAAEVVRDSLNAHGATFGNSQAKRLNDQSIAVTGTVTTGSDTDDWRVVVAINDKRELMAMHVTIGGQETAASDESLHEFFSEASFRTFTDDAGEFSVVARLVDFKNDPSKGGVATLEKEDGSTVEVPTSRLSKSDSEWVRAEIKRRADKK